MASRSIPGRQLSGECGLMERTVLTAGLATEEEVKTWRPGGANNPDRGAQGLLKFLTRLHRFHARGEGKNTTSRSIQDSQVLEALRDQPVTVHLPSHSVNTEPIRVYPKSMSALMMVHGLDVQLTWMCAQREELLRMTSPEALEALPLVLDAISYTYHLLVWIVTSEGPGAPFAAQDDAPEIPEWITKLEPWDFIVICQAHQQHLMRLSALTALLDDKKTPESPSVRPSWSVFYGTLALDMGQPVDLLLKHRSLVSLMASVRLANYSKTPTDDAKT